MSLLQHTLDYRHDSADLFSRIAHEPWAMLLDSGQAIDDNTGQPGSQYGHYDIIVARPIATLVTKGTQTVVEENGQRKQVTEDPFLLLDQLLSSYEAEDTGLPFVGGAMGYFSYDLGRHLEAVENQNEAADIPDMMIGIYDWAIIVDHRQHTCQLVSHGFSEETKKNWSTLCAFFGSHKEATSKPFVVESEVSSNFTQKTYAEAFDQVKFYIQEGDCYQVNLAQRFSAQVQGDSWTAYRKLREISPAPFMSFMQLPISDTDCLQVLSNSPERFIQVVGDHVETRPIKGTRPRSHDPVIDARNARMLQESEKDKAENLMIVDLLRNDIGKSCKTGSVTVERLFQLQSFANVHHLVSIVTGKLKKSASIVSLLKGCFPGGSITGAPKIRAMQIIEALEPNQRGLYCGAIGYISFDGKMDTNIAIRTAVINANEITYYAGGGIVADSISHKEYLETLDKASTMIELLEFFKRRR